ncbi:MAG: GNAT family N-acetyltransferase [Clostridia bacterium]|nr:GNAT family N-acetyltransferase [Clostridia bacterium]
MDIQVRKLAEGDDLTQVSRLIYETDNYIFPHFFGQSTTSAKEILPFMIEADTIYNKNNIYIALLDNQIIAVIVIVPSPISINLGAFIDSFEKANVMIDESFQKVMMEYFIPMEALPEGYYIANLCVDELYRGKGVGSAMLDLILEEIDKEKDVYLDCLTDNARAISVYEAHDFEKLFEFSGFTGLPYYKMIRRASRAQIEAGNLEE